MTEEIVINLSLRTEDQTKKKKKKKTFKITWKSNLSYVPSGRAVEHAALR